VGALISGVHNVTPLFNEHLPMRPFDEDQWEDAFVVIQNIEIYFFMRERSIVTPDSMTVAFHLLDYIFNTNLRRKRYIIRMANTINNYTK